MGTTQSSSLGQLNQVFDGATGYKYAATDRKGNPGGRPSSGRRKSRRMHAEVLAGLFTGNRKSGGSSKRLPPPTAPPPRPPGHAKSGGAAKSTGKSKFQSIVKKVVENNGTAGDAGGKPGAKDTRSAFQRMVGSVIESNGGAAKKDAGESSFAKLVDTLVQLKNSFKAKEIEDEHTLRAKNLRAKYHRNVDAAPLVKEKDPFAEIKDGSIQRLALRQFSSKFKVQREINDERMQSNADFFRANSTRSLAAGMSGRNLNNNLSMRSLKGLNTSMKSNAFFRDPSIKGAMLQRSSKDLNAGASARDLNRVPSMRAGRSIKDLQLMANPSFQDVPRAPSLRESFKRSSSIKKGDLADEDSEIDAATAANTQKNKKRRKLPKLNVSVRADEDPVPDPTKKKGGGLKLDNSLINDMSSTFASGLANGGIGGTGQSAGAGADLRPMTPSADGIFVSESGTVHAGDWKIRETGMTYIGPAGQPGINVPAKAPRSARKLDFMEIGTLGSGASGSVLEALHIPTMSLVAMKMLPVYQVDKLQSIARELSVLYTNLSELSLINGSLDAQDSEANGAPAKTSKHVLALYDAFTDLNSGYVHLVVEYMDGGSLEDIVNSGGCQDENVLADLSYQAMDGLSFLHEHKQIHRDVKPGNILLNSVGEVKIADFGITKVMDANVDKARSFVGTMCYMAPERISSDEYSYNSDVWSLGLSILAVARGEFPLAQEAKEAGYWGLLKVICDDEPPAPGPSFSARFNEFIKECLTRDPNFRKVPAALLESDPFLLRGREVNKKITQQQLAEEHLRRKKYAAEYTSNPSLDDIVAGTLGKDKSLSKSSSEKFNDDSEYNINDPSDHSLPPVEDLSHSVPSSENNIVKNFTQGSLDETEQRDLFDAAPLREKPGALAVKTSQRMGSRGNLDQSGDDGKSPFDFPEELGPGVSPLSILGSYKPWQVQRKGSKNSTAFSALRGGSTSSLLNTPQSTSPSKVHIAPADDQDNSPALTSAGNEDEADKILSTSADDKSKHSTDGDIHDKNFCADDVMAFEAPAVSNTTDDVSVGVAKNISAMSIETESKEKDDIPAPSLNLIPQSPKVTAIGDSSNRSKRGSGKPPAPMLSKRRTSRGGSIGGSKSIVVPQNVSLNKDISDADMSAIIPAAADQEFANAVDGLREEHLLCILECLEDKCRIEEFAAMESSYNDFAYPMSMDVDDAPVAAFRVSRDPSLPVRVPCTTGAGVAKWRHLAAQLLLPVDLVIRMAKMIIAEKYFVNEDAVEDAYFDDL